MDFGSVRCAVKDILFDFLVCPWPLRTVESVLIHESIDAINSRCLHIDYAQVELAVITIVLCFSNSLHVFVDLRIVRQRMDDEQRCPLVLTGLHHRFEHAHYRVSVVVYVTLS